ncbi:hypothetical protein [Nocardia sp. NPDC048505]|uniref:hypothetical protein n=1 Tax=unclassified Nocardia TaxID=2637762 RepID=UPI00340C8914
MKFGIDLLLGDLKWFLIGGFVLLVLAALAWDAVSVPVYWLRDRFGKDEEFEEERAAPSPTRRTAGTRERRAARDAERRAALRAKHAEGGRVEVDQLD